MSAVCKYNSSAITFIQIKTTANAPNCSDSGISEHELHKFLLHSSICNAVVRTILRR